MATFHRRKCLLGNQYLGIDRLIPIGEGSRPIGPDDPGPIEITAEPTGLFHLDQNSVICDRCGNIIRENYLKHHRATGACERNVQKRNQTHSAILIVNDSPSRRSG